MSSEVGCWPFAGQWVMSLSHAAATARPEILTGHGGSWSHTRDTLEGRQVYRVKQVNNFELFVCAVFALVILALAKVLL